LKAEAARAALGRVRKSRSEVDYNSVGGKISDKFAY
jgi:hypothetical protein